MSVHADAIKVLKAHGFSVFALLSGQTLVRVLAFFPVYLPLLFPDLQSSFPFSSLPVRAALCAALYLFIAFPCRFRAASALVRMTDRERKIRQTNYACLVLGGALRAFYQALWSGPLLVCLYYLYQYFYVYVGSELEAVGKLIERAGEAVNSVLPLSDPYASGLGVLAVFFALCCLLSAYGWRRLIPFDMLLGSAGNTGNALRAAKVLRKRRACTLRANAYLHFLLLLPAFAAMYAVLYLRCQDHLQVFLNLHLAFSEGIVLDAPMFYLAALAFFALYLPLLPYRMLRNAVAVSDHGKNS